MALERCCLRCPPGIHLDLYLTGYRSIPTIGWLFLLQVIVAFALTAAVLVTHSWVAAAASAGFALSTLGAYLIAVWVGLFGFKEIRTRAGIAAGLIEVAAFGVLALAAISVGAALQADGPSPGPGYGGGCGGSGHSDRCGRPRLGGRRGLLGVAEATRPAHLRLPAERGLP